MPIRRASITISIIFIAVCLIIGCGGGGGGGSSTGTGGGGGGTTQIECVVASSPTTVQDPLNIMVADSVTFELVHYDSAGVRTVVTPGLWATTDTLAAAGTLDPSSGTLTATAPSGGPFTVSTNAGGVNYQAQYFVTPIQSRLLGRVVDAVSGLGVPGIKVVFYNGSSVQVGSITSAYDGNFRASLPTTAKTFNLDPTSIPAVSYYRAYSYIGTTQGKISGTSSGSNGSTSGTSTSLKNGASTGVSTGGNTSTTLNNTGAGWTAGALVGYSVTISSGTGNGQIRTVTANTSTTLTIGSPWTSTPDSSSGYALNSNILIDGSASWTTNAFANYSVTITGGTGVGQSVVISSNTATTLTLSSPWTTTPDNTSTYLINSNILKDASANWLAAEIAPRQVYITSGTGFGQSRTVTGNTNTQLSVSPPWSTTPDSSSAYQLGTLRYSPTVPCGSNLPSGMANGVTTAMPGNIVMPPSNQTPPGPPNGCG